MEVPPIPPNASLASAPAGACGLARTWADKAARHTRVAAAAAEETMASGGCFMKVVRPVLGKVVRGDGGEQKRGM